ncbi:sphingomyelin phosphodiesterase 4-like [Styela clava]
MRSAENEINNSLQMASSNFDIQETCKSLTQVIETCGVHSLGNIFQKLVEDIFINKTYKWCLVRSGVPMADFGIVRRFLGPDGAMFQLINRMQMHGVQVKGPDMVALGEFHSDLMYDPQRLGCPFESYFCYFSHIITKLSLNTTISNNMFPHNRFNLRNPNLLVSGAEDLLYFVLLDDYLSYYLPSGADAKPPTLNTGGLFNTSTKVHRNITKSSFLLRHDSNNVISHGQPSHSETWCCDVLMNIFTTFWMYGFQPNRSEFSSGSAVRGKVPTENHVRAVRLLVKHVHFFCNAHMGNTLTKRFQNDSILEQLDQNLMNKFQPKLFLFLQHCFEVWPLDHTFRIVLETWLSYIQPWRYVKNDFPTLSSDCNVNNNWYHFVYANIQFYSALFQVVIRRFIRMDIGTMGNSFLLFRVAKVYSQPNLITLIDQAHEANPQLAYSQLSGNFESYVISQSYGAVEPKDDDLFSPVFIDVVRQLLLIISQALETTKSSAASANSDWSNQVLTFCGYGAFVENNDSGSTGPDKKKIEQNLNYALKTFCDIFELPLPKLDTVSRKSPGRGSDIADYELDENGKMSLSPTGRFQLQNKLKKFPILPNVDPDLRPICSFENAFLVRFLHKLSSKFNGKYQHEIEELCKKNDILGKVCKILFEQPDEFPALKHGFHPKPHLSLRFIAHYRNIFYIFMLYALSLFFRFNFVYSCIYIVFLLVIIIFFRALFSKD